MKITGEECKQWSTEIDGIAIPENVFNVIDIIRKKLQLHNDKEGNRENQIYISDRRWRKIVRLLRTSAFLNDRTAVDLMDCFLIKECIWNEDVQRKTVADFVSDAIQKHGYKLSFDFKSLKEDLEDFQEEIKSETRFVKPVKYTKRKEYEIQNKKYYRVLIKGLLDYDVDDMIEKDIIDNLKESADYIETKRWRKDMGDKDPIWLKKSKDVCKIFMKDNNHTAKEYPFECFEEQKNEKFTKKPHKVVEESWDKKVKQYLEVTNRQKDELNLYRNKDLAHLRTNLFVNPVLANIVETHLTNTQKGIEKYEVEIRKIQNDYKKLKDEEVVVK
ncbi:MAG: hypothetical protein LBG45_00400 [Dysgonamonadaceae bacterium]|nr:hypothetical protein [Dysgonamonadaceae bacterium]